MHWFIYFIYGVSFYKNFYKIYVIIIIYFNIASYNDKEYDILAF